MAQTRKTTSSKTKPSRKPTTKPATRPNNRSTAQKNPSKIICIILVIIAALAAITGVVAYIISRNADTIVVENGKGEQVKTKYVTVSDYKYRVAVPADFKPLSADDIAKKYNDGEVPEAVYANEDDTIEVTFFKPENNLKNDQVQDYVDAMKTILATGMDVIESKTYEVQGHKVGIIRFANNLNNEQSYDQELMFSYNDKLARITFTCTGEQRGEWEKVGQAIMASLKFDK